MVTRGSSYLPIPLTKRFSVPTSLLTYPPSTRCLRRASDLRFYRARSQDFICFVTNSDSQQKLDV